jgi:superoxide reductase
MTKRKEIYKCEGCGNIVEVINEGVGELVCCNQPMQLLEEHTEDQGLEKHVPVITKEEGKVIVEVGDVEHPMTQEHFIQWIELTVDGKSCKKFLTPDDKPRAVFNVPNDYSEISAREYCNIHGLWKA